MDTRPSYLSIWDLGHHWIDRASTSDDEARSPELQRSLSMIMQAVALQGLAAVEPVLMTQAEGPESGRHSVEMIPIGDLTELHGSLITGRYERSVLSGYMIYIGDLFEWCIWNDVDIPDFVVPDRRVPVFGAPTAETSPTRPDVANKRLCQEIAVEKWKQDPSVRIAEMARDEDVLRKGNGKLYEEATLCRWLREVAPPLVRGRRGRPLKRVRDQTEK